MKQLFTVLFFLIVVHFTQAQKNIFLSIAPKFLSNDFVPDQIYTSASGDKVAFQHFNYYVSHLTLYHDGGQTLSLADTVFILKPDHTVLYLGQHAVIQIDSIQFGAGVAPEFNTQSGSLAQDISTYDANHPLSFQSPSMYWGWSSGYMHMVVGGKVDANNDQNPETVFEVHSLGNANFHEVKLNTHHDLSNPNQIDLQLECNLDQWIKGVNLKTVGVAHGETGINAQVMNNPLNFAVFTQPVTASLDHLNVDHHLTFQKINQEVVITFDQVPANSSWNIVNLNGQQLGHFVNPNKSGAFKINHTKNELWIVTIHNTEGKMIYTKKILL